MADKVNGICPDYVNVLVDNRESVLTCNAHLFLYLFIYFAFYRVALLNVKIDGFFCLFDVVFFLSFFLFLLSIRLFMCRNKYIFKYSFKV